MMSKPIDQERAIFENWYLSLPYGSPNFYDLRELADGSYKFASVRQLWDCWQARAAVQPAGVAVPKMVDFSPVPDDFRNQATGYRAGWNDCRAMLAAAPQAVSGEQEDT